MSTQTPGFHLRVAIGLLAGLASLWAVLRAQNLAIHSGVIDYYQYWLIGQFMDQGGFRQIYSPRVYDSIGAAGMQFAAGSGSRRMQAAAKTNAELYPYKLEPNSTPFLYACFRSISSGDYERDANRYQLLCTLAFAAGVVVFARSVRFNWPAALVALAATLTWFGPFKVDILDGNTARLQLAGLAMALGAIVFLPRRIVGGVLLAIGVAFKPNTLLAPVLLLAVYALTRRWRALLDSAVGLLAGGAIAILASSLWLRDFGIWLDWLRKITVAAGTRSSVYSLQNQNCSFARLVSDRIHFDLSWLLLAGAIGAVVIPLICQRSPSDPPKGPPEANAIAAGTLAMLFSSPIVWPSYFVMLLPAILYLARPAKLSAWSLTRWITAAVAFICVAASDEPWLPLGLSALVYVLGGASAAMLIALVIDGWLENPR